MDCVCECVSVCVREREIERDLLATLLMVAGGGADEKLMTLRKIVHTGMQRKVHSANAIQV
jgi:hypothetical protein